MVVAAVFSSVRVLTRVSLGVYGNLLDMVEPVALRNIDHAFIPARSRMSRKL